MLPSLPKSSKKNPIKIDSNIVQLAQTYNQSTSMKIFHTNSNKVLLISSNQLSVLFFVEINQFR